MFKHPYVRFTCYKKKKKLGNLKIFTLEINFSMKYFSNCLMCVMCIRKPKISHKTYTRSVHNMAVNVNGRRKTWLNFHFWKIHTWLLNENCSCMCVLSVNGMMKIVTTIEYYNVSAKSDFNVGITATRKMDITMCTDPWNVCNVAQAAKPIILGIWHVLYEISSKEAKGVRHIL